MGSWQEAFREAELIPEDVITALDKSQQAVELAGKILARSDEPAATRALVELRSAWKALDNALEWCREPGRKSPNE